MNLKSTMSFGVLLLLVGVAPPTPAIATQSPGESLAAMEQDSDIAKKRHVVFIARYLRFFALLEKIPDNIKDPEFCAAFLALPNREVVGEIKESAKHILVLLQRADALAAQGGSMPHRLHAALRSGMPADMQGFVDDSEKLQGGFVALEQACKEEGEWR